jgi:hypothetical protein
LAFAPQCDYLIINEQIEPATDVLYGIIQAERSRRALLALREHGGFTSHRFSYSTLVLPVFGGDVLYHREGKHFPTGRLLQGELPHEGALRVLYEKLHITVEPRKLLRSSHDFVLTLEIEGDDRNQVVVFDFIYLLHMRIAAPEGWEWRPLNSLELSEALLNHLRANTVL